MLQNHIFPLSFNPSHGKIYQNTFNFFAFSTWSNCWILRWTPSKPNLIVNIHWSNPKHFRYFVNFLQQKHLLNSSEYFYELISNTNQFYDLKQPLILSKLLSSVKMVWICYCIKIHISFSSMQKDTNPSFWFDLYF